MIWNRLQRQQQRDQDFVQELEAYIEQETADNMARGIPPAEARAAAVRKFGNRTAIREQVHEMNSYGWLEDFWQDIRYGVRALRLNPGFTATAVLSLALGIGANTAFFQLVNALMLRSLPVSNPQALVRLYWKVDGRNRNGYYWSGPNDFTYPLWEQVRANHEPFADVFAWADHAFNLAPTGDSRFVPGIYASGNFFQALGVSAAIGRVFSVQDDQPGCGSPGVVIGDAFWRREYGADPSVIGRPISLQGHPFEIIGVTQPGFAGVEIGRRFDVALPLCAQPGLGEALALKNRMFWWLDIMARPAPGVSVARADAYLDAVSPGILAAAAPELKAEDVRQFVRMKLGVEPAGNGVSALRTQVQDPLLLLLCIAALVLLIACANIANLLLARATVRGREIAIRFALGASRWRIIRQLLSESLLLAVTGCLIGGALAQMLSRYLLALFSTGRRSVFLDLGTDWHTLGFLAGLAVLACLFFGLAPALRATRNGPGSAMKSAGRGLTATRERFGLQRLLVVSQISLSLILLAGSLLFVRSLRGLLTLDPGFRESGVVVANLAFDSEPVAKEKRLPIFREILDQLRKAPGIDSATTAVQIPMTGSYFQNGFRIPASGPGASQTGHTNLNIVGDGYFQTMGTPLLAGRDFNAHDTTTAPLVDIVDQSFADKFFPGESPLGKIFFIDGGPGQPSLSYQIVGLVKNAKYANLHDDFAPTAFFPQSQDPNPGSDLTFIVRSSLSLASTVAGVRNIMQGASPRASLEFRSFPAIVKESVRREDILAKLSSLFGFLAVALAAIGLYGVMSYLVTQRRNEIGVRLAVGANRWRIIAMVLRESSTLLLVGLAAGTVLALSSHRAVESMLFNLKATDPSTIGLAIFVITLVTLAATLIPARRAANIDPMTALRDE